MQYFDAKLALAELIERRRLALNISRAELARRAGVDPGLITKLSQCKVEQPTASTMQGLAMALEVPLADVYAETSWTGIALPSLRPYMRAKYDRLPEAALEEIERFIDWMTAKYGTGPQEGEDE